MSEYYTHPVPSVLAALQSNQDGISAQEAQRRLQQHGPNQLPRTQATSAWKIFLNQFANGLIVLMVVAAVFSLILGEFIEATAIAGIILLNALMGFIQEDRAERTLESLRKVAAPTAVVMRGGTESNIPAREVVPGDVIIIEEG